MVPFFGLIVMSLFKNSFWSFFGRLGEVPAWVITVVIMALVGPFGALPRCVVIAHSTLECLSEDISGVVQFVKLLRHFFLTIKPTRVLDVLGKFLTDTIGVLNQSLFFGDCSRQAQSGMAR